MIPRFIHLKLHTEYSIVDGAVRIVDLIDCARAMKMPAVAVTDRMNLFGLIKFYRSAIKQGIKPLVGTDLIVIEDSEKEPPFEITVFCKNQTGYRNLTRLLSRAYLEGQRQGNPMIHQSWLFNASDGLIILSGAERGDIGQAVLAKNFSLAEQRLQVWLNYFPNHFYLELQRVGKAREEEYIHEALNLAQKFHLPVVATNDVRFLSPDDFEAHEARVCIYDGRVLHDENRPHLYTESQYFKTPEEMEKLFADIPESLANTVEIAKRCNLTLSLGKPFLPNFPVPEGETLENYLAQEAQAGLLDYLKKQSLSGNPLEAKKYEERLKLELKVINTMGFPGYFLIVADFIRWSKTHGIPVGPGRGSGAGSLVAYCLGITEVDPLKHDLLFERFLNPERISMPDFDIDFCMEGRDRVIEYVAERYGQDCVSQIITYGTMAARAVVRDVGRVLGMPYGYVDKIAKLIPFELGITLDQALEREPLLKKRYEEEDIHTLIDLAKKLEGLTRNAGKHAGGVVIAPTQLTDFTPLYCEPDGSNLITQFDKDDVEAVGLVKFDFLGLRTLTIINWAMETINAKRKKNNESLLNISDIPLDDPLTFDLLKKCETRAVFQLESRGMRDLIRRLQPDCFDDITALVALFRPGPLQSGMVDDFINRKRGTSPVIYSHPDLEPILKSTYGVILYQEQVMQIAQVLAGYSLGSADILRRAMGKKKPDEMARQRAIFLDGATKKNIEPKLANYIFDLMEKFAGYGFNKSHSVAYALIAYQTAWLKAHYPAEFMAAVLSSDMDNTDKLVDFVYECKRMQLILLPPNINTDYYRFTVNKENKIRYGLGAIKGVGESVVMCITDERKNNGNYENLFDLCGRTDHGKLNRRALEALICSGAIDIFIDKNSSLTRASLLASIDKALQFAEQTHHNRSSGQADLFGGDDQINSMQKNMDYVSVPRWTEQIKLAHEKQALGFYMSGHPMKAYQKDFRQLTLAMNELKIQKGQKVDVAGLVISLKTLMTRSGDRMAIVALEDLTGRLDVVVFSDLFDSVRELLSSDQILIVNGEVSSDDFSGGIKLVADSVVSWENFRAGRAKALYIRIGEKTREVSEQLGKLLKFSRGGKCPVVIDYANGKARAKLQLGEDWNVQVRDELLEQLRDVFGAENVALLY